MSKFCNSVVKYYTTEEERNEYSRAVCEGIAENRIIFEKRENFFLKCLLIGSLLILAIVLICIALSAIF